MKSEIRPAMVAMTLAGLKYVCASFWIVLHLLNAEKDKRRHISSELPSPRTNASGIKANA
jgi:hypothetical protein